MAKLPPEPKSHEITSPELYARRRELLKTGALYVATSAGVAVGLSQLSVDDAVGQGQLPTRRGDATAFTDLDTANLHRAHRSRLRRLEARELCLGLETRPLARGEGEGKAVGEPAWRLPRVGHW